MYKNRGKFYTQGMPKDGHHSKVNAFIYERLNLCWLRHPHNILVNDNELIQFVNRSWASYTFQVILTWTKRSVISSEINEKKSEQFMNLPISVHDTPCIQAIKIPLKRSKNLEDGRTKKIIGSDVVLNSQTMNQKYYESYKEHE